MNSIKKTKKSIAILLLLALATNQVSAFSLGSITRSFRSIFTRKKPASKSKQVFNWVGNNIESIFWGTVLGSAITLIAIHFLDKKDNNPDNPDKIDNTPKAKPGNNPIRKEKNITFKYDQKPQEQTTQNVENLFKACHDGDIEKIKESIKNGADINHENASGTPVYIALEKCAISQDENNIKLLWYLVDNGANIESAWVKFERKYKNNIDRKLIDLLTPFMEKLSLSKKVFTQKGEKTKKILFALVDKSTPVRMKQKELINIIKLYQANLQNSDLDIKIDLNFIKQCFQEIPFNTTFLHDLCEQDLIEFIMDNQIIDKHNRNVIDAALIYCKNENDIEKILSNLADKWDLTEREKYKIAKKFIEIPLPKQAKQKFISLSEHCKNLFTSNEKIQKENTKIETKTDFFRNVLEKAKIRNPVFYKEMLHQLNS